MDLKFFTDQEMDQFDTPSSNEPQEDEEKEREEREEKEEEPVESETKERSTLQIPQWFPKNSFDPERRVRTLIKTPKYKAPKETTEPLPPLPTYTFKINISGQEEEIDTQTRERSHLKEPGMYYMCIYTCELKYCIIANYHF